MAFVPFTAMAEPETLEEALAVIAELEAEVNTWKSNAVEASNRANVNAENVAAWYNEAMRLQDIIENEVISEDNTVTVRTVVGNEVEITSLEELLETYNETERLYRYYRASFISYQDSLHAVHQGYQREQIRAGAYKYELEMQLVDEEDQCDISNDMLTNNLTWGQVWDNLEGWYSIDHPCESAENIRQILAEYN